MHKPKVLIIIEKLSTKLQKIMYFVLVLCIFSTPIIFAQSDHLESAIISVSVDKGEGAIYSKFENIVISGNVGNESATSIISIIDPNGIVVWAEPISSDSIGNFSIVVEAGISNWNKSGNYKVKLESGNLSQDTVLFYDSGQQVNPPSVIDEFYVSESDLYFTFSAAVIIIIGIFIFLARLSLIHI